GVEIPARAAAVVIEGNASVERFARGIDTIDRGRSPASGAEGTRGDTDGVSVGLGSRSGLAHIGVVEIADNVLPIDDGLIDDTLGGGGIAPIHRVEAASVRSRRAAVGPDNGGQEHTAFQVFHLQASRRLCGLTQRVAGLPGRAKMAQQMTQTHYGY